MRDYLQKHITFLLPIAIISLIIGIVITWNGVNAHYDAMWYIVYARSVQAGHGLSVPISSYNSPITTGWINQWPPLYPLVIALGFGWDLMLWAHVLSISLLIATILMTYALTVMLTDSRCAGFIAALLTLTIPALTREGFSYSRSETLFTALGLLFLLMLSNYHRGHETPNIRAALWAAFTVVLLTLTRYVGVAFAFMGVAWSILFALRRNQPRRWHPLIAFILSFVPLGLYALYLKATTGSLTGTQTTADSFTLSGALRGIETVLIESLHGITFVFRLIGLRSNLWGLLGGALIVSVLAWTALRRENRLRDLLNPLHALVIAYIASYTVMFWMLGARSQIITEETVRHYIVIFPPLVALIVSLLSRINASRYLFAALIAIYALSGIVSMRVPAAGMSYNRTDWRTDPLLHNLPNHLPENTLLHTQYTPLLSYLVGIDVPVRTFGSISAFENFTCDQITYPEPYINAAFTLIDSAYLRETPPVDVENYLRTWAAPCGDVISYENNGFTMLMVIALSPNASPVLE